MNSSFTKGKKNKKKSRKKVSILNKQLSLALFYAYLEVKINPFATAVTKTFSYQEYVAV